MSLQSNTTELEAILAAVNDLPDMPINPPYVGENGNWHEWDKDANTFVDTGVPATGPEGPVPVLDADDWALEQDTDTGYVYVKYQGVRGTEGIPLASSGGGGTGSGGATYTVTLRNTSPSRTITVPEGETCELSFEYTSVDSDDYGDGPGTGTLTIDGINKSTFVVHQGSYSLDISRYLTSGEHTVRIRVTNSEGVGKVLSYTVTLLALSMKTTLTPMGYYSGDTTFYYTPVGPADKTVHFKMDGTEIGSTQVTSSGKSQSFAIPSQTHGAHIFEAYADVTYEGNLITSNTIKLGMLWVDENSMNSVILSTFDTTECYQGETLTVPFLVYDPTSETATITRSVLTDDGSIYSSQEITVPRSTQNWVVSDYPVGNITIRITCGSVTLDKQLTVNESENDIDAVIDSQLFVFDPSGRSNEEDEPAQWSNGTIAATFSGVGFTVADGWMIDSEGASLLRLLPGGEMTIPFNPFANDVRNAGMTIEVEMSTHNVRDYDTVVLSSLSGGRGLKIASQYARITSEQTELSMQFKEDDKVRVSFVIESQSLHRLIYIYVNGVMCRAIQYSTADNFAQVTPVGLTVGAETSGIDLYRIRIYNKGLNRREILDNYIADRARLAERIKLIERNDIFDLSENIVISKLPPDLPYMIIKCPELPQTKGDKKTCEIEYVNVAEPARSFTATGVEIDVQGTSSAGYKKKNWKNKYKKGIKYTSNNLESETYLLRADSIPSAVFCMKADVASSEGANNVELVRLYNDTVPHKTPAQLSNDKVRVGIDGLPCVIFWQNTTTGEVLFWGKYNFNFDKSSEEVYGLTDGCESWEIRNNTSNRVVFKSSDFTSLDPETGKGAWLNDFEGRYPDGYEDYTNLKVMCDWLVLTDRDAVSSDSEKVARLNKFKNEFEDHFIKTPMLYYYVFTEVFLMVDNRAKNFFPTTFDGVHWFPFPYDMDTALGINNEGQLVFDYDLEDTDTVGGANVFNGQNSVLWCNIRDAFQDEIKEIYTNLRSGDTFNYDTIIKRFADHQNTWPEAIWNEDAWNKYLEPLENDNNPNYLEMLQGDKESQREWWLYNGLRYRDSKYQCGDAKEKFITLRCYEVGDITITPYSHIWPWIKYGSYTVHTRGKRNVPITLECPLDSMNDTEVYIYSADRLAAIGDLSPMQVGYADFTDAVKLQTLKLGDGAEGYQNTRLTSLAVGNNELLTLLDVRNCINLAQAVDLTGCISLEEVKAKGTVTTGFTLPVGGKLKSLELPNTVTNLTIRDQTQFETLDMTGYGNIETLRIENTPNVPIEAIVSGATKLNRVRLFNVSWNATNETTLLATVNKLKTCIGQDAAGGNTAAAVVTGRVSVPSISVAALTEVNSAYPDLIVVADGVPQYIVRYLDWDNSILYQAIVSEGSNAVNAVTAGYISTPVRAGTETTGYAFKDFGTLPTNIKNNVSVVAQYEDTYRVRFINEGSVFETQWVVEGENADIPSGTPTKADEQLYKYTFSSWEGSLINVAEPRDIVATYMTSYRVRFMNEGLVFDTQWISHGGNASTPTGTPTKSNEELYHYTFKEWSGTLTNITAAVDITATYTTLYRVQFVNESSVYATQWVAHGSNATTPTGTPTKAETAQYRYEFASWSGSMTNVTEPRTLTATYNSITQTYTVYFYNGNTLLQTVTDVPYGSSVTYEGEDPVKTGVDNPEYWRFVGWEPNGTNIISDTSCYAQFSYEVSIESPWAVISEISAAGTAENYLAVGDCKEITLSGICGEQDVDGTFYVYILGFNHNSEVEGNGITFGGFKTSAGSDGKNICLIEDGLYQSPNKDLYHPGFSMSRGTSSSVGSWSGSNMRYDVLGSTNVRNENATETCAISPKHDSLMSCLPADLRAVMKPLTKYTFHSSNTISTIDYLPLLAEFEIFGTIRYANSDEQNFQMQYSYYAAGNSKVKYCHSSTGSAAVYWLRSLKSNASQSQGCVVSASGTVTYYYSYISLGIAPIFLV